MPDRLEGGCRRHESLVAVVQLLSRTMSASASWSLAQTRWWQSCPSAASAAS